MTDKQDINTLGELSMSIQRHDAVLETLKDVPLLLNEMAKKVGVVPPKEKSSWSLNLSDEEDEIDVNADANKIIGQDNDDDDLAQLLQDMEQKVDFGPPVIQNVSVGFGKTVARPLTKESKLGLQNQIKIPENCKEFVVPKVNAEIWRMLPSQAKLHDIKQQQSQQVLSLALSTLASIANSIVSNKDKISKDIVSSVIKQAIDGANLLGDQFQSMTGRRRFAMKSFLNPEYAGICSAQLASSEWLFGSDLAENLKSSKATSGLMKNTMNRNARYQPYSQQTRSYQGQSSSRPALNWNRPLQQSRGSGQYTPRFDRRPLGQFRFQQQNQFNQPRYRRN